MAITYRGFSTVNRNKKFRVVDFELVKQDLLNHFYIRKGEKLMNPDFGTIIWNVIHEPFTEELKAVIIEDVRSVIKYDPRVSVENVIITQYEHGLQIELDLTYIPDNQVNILAMRFDNRTQTIQSV